MASENVDIAKLMEIEALCELTLAAIRIDPSLTKVLINKFRSQIFHILLEKDDETKRT